LCRPNAVKKIGKDSTGKLKLGLGRMKKEVGDRRIQRNVTGNSSKKRMSENQRKSVRDSDKYSQSMSEEVGKG
jgi:hypothetical protein